MLTGLHHAQQEAALLMLTLPNGLLQKGFALSECQGSNLRPQHPKCRALPTALHPVFSHTIIRLISSHTSNFTEKPILVYNPTEKHIGIIPILRYTLADTPGN